MSGVERLRKAWAIRVTDLDGEIIAFAPRASNARAAVIHSLMDAWDCRWSQAMREIVSVRRAQGRDVIIPARHPLAPQLHPEILHCVVHAYGGTGLNAGYRDHFYTSADDWPLRAALYHGLFRVFRRDAGRDGSPDHIMYALTEMGKNVARGEAEAYPEARR